MKITGAIVVLLIMFLCAIAGNKNAENNAYEAIKRYEKEKVQQTPKIETFSICIEGKMYTVSHKEGENSLSFTEQLNQNKEHVKCGKSTQ